MKKKTFLLLTFLFTVQGIFAQFSEDFTSRSLNGWVQFNGENNQGSEAIWFQFGSEFVAFASSDGNTLKQGWLVTPKFSITSDYFILNLEQRDNGCFGSDDYSDLNYTIRVSTESQTNHSDFTIVDLQDSADDIGRSGNIREVDLSAYIGQEIHLAFVMEYTKSCVWYLNSVSLLDYDKPNCIDSQTIYPKNEHNNVNIKFVNDETGILRLLWNKPAGGIVTKYKLLLGESPDDLNNEFETSNTYFDIDLKYETTYYWKFIPENIKGITTNCDVYTFTTGSLKQPPANDTISGAIPFLPSPKRTNSFCEEPNTITTLNFSTDGTRDSGLNGSCVGNYAGMDQFFTWTATSDALLFNSYSDGTGIVIRKEDGEQIDCNSTFQQNNVLKGWDIGDKLIIQIYIYDSPLLLDVLFELEELDLNVDLLGNGQDYINDFCIYPGLQWVESRLNDDGQLNYNGSSFFDGFFANDNQHINGKSAKINIYVDSNDFLISNPFDLSGGTYYLNFDLAITEWETKNTSSFGANDYLKLLVSEDSGANWSEIRRWDSLSSISNSGTSSSEIELPGSEIELSGYGDNVIFAFHAFADDIIDNDIDLFIDNFQITGATLGSEENKIEKAVIFPTIVNDYLSYQTTSQINDIEIFNILGQSVFIKKIDNYKGKVNLTALEKGIYLVKISYDNHTESQKIIKE